MKRLLVILLLGMLCVIGARFIFPYDECSLTTPTVTYATVEGVIKDRVISRGWLPQFFPSLATNIKLKTHSSHNQVLAAFSFTGSHDVSWLPKGARALSEVEFRHVQPGVICKKEPWFSDALHKGKFDELTSQGFSFSIVSETEKKGISETRITHWFLAVNAQAGVCYLWTGFGQLPDSAPGSAKVNSTG